MNVTLSDQYRTARGPQGVFVLVPDGVGEWATGESRVELDVSALAEQRIARRLRFFDRCGSDPMDVSGPAAVS